MKVAFISLPNENTPVNGVFNSMHGYWVPPEFVLSFWANSCKIEYLGEEDYDIKKKIVTDSYMGAIHQFYSDNAL